MGKTFDVGQFRLSPGYCEGVPQWCYEGNLSCFDMGRWLHEWFGGDSEFSGIVDFGMIETVCEFRSKLNRANDQLFHIMDKALDRNNRHLYEIARSIQSEIIPEIDLIDEWLWEE